MQPHNGTSILDWKYYEDQAKDMDLNSLFYAHQDCQNVIRESDIETANFPCKARGFYYDLASVYWCEINRRRG